MERRRFDAIKAQVYANRAALVASMSPTELAKYDAAEARKPDPFDLLEPNPTDRDDEEVDLAELEALTIEMLGPEGIEFLTNLKRSDYRPFSIGDVDHGD